MQAVVKIHLMSLESIFRLQSFVKTKDAFKIVHQQSTEADQNEQKYQQLLLRLEISLFKMHLLLTRNIIIFSSSIEKNIVLSPINYRLM